LRPSAPHRQAVLSGVQRRWDRACVRGPRSASAGVIRALDEGSTGPRAASAVWVSGTRAARPKLPSKPAMPLEKRDPAWRAAGVDSNPRNGSTVLRSSRRLFLGPSWASDTTVT
jgi:hypothetical protein